MFTALVAILLVLTGTVLVNTLVSTEEKTSGQIYSTLNNYELIDAANLARADAIQTFNYNFRSRVEYFLSYGNSDAALNKMDARGFEIMKYGAVGDTMDFDKAKTSFEQFVLISGRDGQFGAVIDKIASDVIDQINTQEGSYGKFRVYLSDTSVSAKNTVALAMKESIQAQPGNFLEVVGCGPTNPLNTNECPNGSFYFNVPLSQVPDATYEKLPRIVVKDLLTQEEIKLPLLPRSDLKIYIPIRYFKALWQSIKAYDAIKATHSKVEDYRLGFCEIGSCAPRTNPLQSASATTWNKKCPESAGDGTETLAGLNAEYTLVSGNTYQPGGTAPGQLQLYGISTVDECNSLIASGVFASMGTDFKIVGQNLEANPSEGRLAAITGCAANRIGFNPAKQNTNLIRAAVNPYLACSKVGKVEVDLLFEESNPIYLVKGTGEAGRKNFYKIMISDGAFTTPPVLLPSALGNCDSTPTSCSPA